MVLVVIISHLEIMGVAEVAVVVMVLGAQVLRLELVAAMAVEERLNKVDRLAQLVGVVQ
jgi:hypothetical protein